MNEAFVKKHNLEEAIKRFKQINEYTFITNLVEDDEENPQEDNTEPQDNVNGDNGTEQMSPDANDNSGTDNQLPMGDDMPNDDNNMPPMNGNEINTDVEEVETEEIDTVGEGDEVIDVDDLTQSQEATEVKVDDFGNKLNKMMTFLDKVTQAIELSNQKIDNLSQEFEKRNPTEEEKLNIRSQASYPYSETPKGYWDNKVATDSRYNVIYDNEVSTAEEPKKFEITVDDIQNINPKEVEDSFDIKKSYNLGDYFKF